MIEKAAPFGCPLDFVEVLKSLSNDRGLSQKRDYIYYIIYRFVTCYFLNCNYIRS